MPYKRKRRGSYGHRRRRRNYGLRKRFRRGKRGTRASTSIVRSPTMVPDRMFLKFRYSQANTLTGSALSAFILRGNSPYDPYWSTGGSTATGWNQWAAFYDRYVCFGSKIKVSFINEASTSAYVFIYPDETTTILASLDAIKSQPYTRYRLAGATGSSRDCITLKHYQSVRKALGLAKMQSQNNDYCSDMTNNPPREFYWHVGAWSFDGSSVANVLCSYEMIFYVALYRRNNVYPG